jgi:hypothetical protein
MNNDKLNINNEIWLHIPTQQLHDQVYMGKDLQDPAKENEEELIKYIR